MTISGKILDNTGSPLSYANVYFSDANGKPVSTEATQSDDNGVFKLDTANAYTHVTMSMTGMQPTTVPISVALDTPGMENTFTVENKENSATSKDVVITATRLPKPKTTPWAVIIAVTVVIAVTLGGLYWYLKSKTK